MKLQSNKISFRLTKAAKESLLSIGRYTAEQWGNAQRNKYLQDLDDHFNLLTKFPKKGRLRNEIMQDLRSTRVKYHHIFYLLHEHEIVIVDILHKRMDPLQHLCDAELDKLESSNFDA
jgi:toxin ParE1/3/4